LLTGLRPAIAGYAYVSERLRQIGQAVRFPREDIVTMRDELRSALERLAALEKALDPDEIGSPASRQSAALGELRQSYERLRLALDTAQASNAAEHARLSREAEQAVARISADGQVLDHVRELLRFFKSA
jgi:PAS domain-containing protein